MFTAILQFGNANLKFFARKEMPCKNKVAADEGRYSSVSVLSLFVPKIDVKIIDGVATLPFRFERLGSNV